MRVRYKVATAGPGAARPGEEREVPPAEGARLCAAGIAEAVPDRQHELAMGRQSGGAVVPQGKPRKASRRRRS